MVIKKNEIKIWKIIVTGLIITVISQVIHSACANLSMDFYTEEKYFPVWSKIMMPEPGPPPMSFLYYSIGFGIITGIIYTAVYVFIRGSLPNNNLTRKGIDLGLLLFFVAGVPGYLSMYLLINLPMMLIIYWAIEGLIIYLLSGIIISWINK